MAEEKKNIPKLRFREFTGDNANAWELRRADEIFKTISDKGHPDLTVLSASQEHGMIPRNDVGVDIKYDKKNTANYKRVKPEQFVIHLRSFQGGFAWSEIEGITSPAYTVLDYKETGKYSFDFWKEVLTSPNFIKRLESVTYGIRDGRSISFSDFSTLKFSSPEIREQQKIGSFFKHLDELITLHQRMLDEYKTLKKTMLSKMFPKNGEKYPELRFSGFTDAWELRKLGEMGKTFSGLSGKKKEDFGHGNARFVTYMNVFNNTITNPKLLEKVELDNKQNKVKFGDVFFTTSSETPEEVGMSSIWLDDLENVYLNSFCFGYRTDIEMSPYYLAFVLRSPNVRKKFMVLAQGISRYNISKNKVMNISIPIPDIGEQQKIGSFFKHLDELITLHQRELELLKTLKKTMLQQMFV
ncbi:restriction endonuclease subunit S [Ligilactobacillus animalis]|uniref:restriction endonuclease subunit S n=2 Tax=Ligilactobacillus TaxID=2767887 RepID=UPI00384A7AED